MTEVLSTPFHGASHFPSSPLQSSSHTDLASLNTSIPFSDRANSKPSYTHSEYETGETASTTSTSSSASSSPQLTHASFSRDNSYTATSASSLSLDIKADLEDDDIPFPSFESPGAYGRESDPVPSIPIDYEPPAQSVSSPREDTTDLPAAVNDDQALEPEPTRHVDYLSHEWKEEDIWSSWRYVVTRRKAISNSVRLENASWRTWMKAKNHLKTVSPEKLNWLKDCDVTWLYGPLQSDTKRPLTTANSPPPSRLSHSSSFISKKPILKKKSASVAMLEKSLSTHSLLKQAGALLRSQQSSPAHGRPTFRRSPASFSVAASTASSVANTPAEYDGQQFSSLRQSLTVADLPSAECRHIHFNNEVEQVIAIESDDDDDKEEEIQSVFSEDEDDDGGLMMRPATTQARLSNRSTPRGSFSNESKTIAPLPSTTLKYRGDTPEPDLAQQLRGKSSLWPSGRRLSPSPSQETLRPSRPSHNFLIDDDDENSDLQWQPSVDSSSGMSSPYDSEGEPGPGMRRTDSGMFMPYDENGEATVNRTIFGQALNAVYTVKDIAHVVWNVGWGK